MDSIVIALFSHYLSKPCGLLVIIAIKNSIDGWAQAHSGPPLATPLWTIIMTVSIINTP